MSYQVLARKFRPGSFEGLIGQEHVVRALTHALDNDRLHHAYLFTGTRGVGKTTIARVLAKSLNCEKGVSSSPCNECSICQEVNENRFVDLIEVDAASRTRVDDTRELLENAQYLPSRGRYKVYLIDEVHMLSASSFNALLKTLEEPPEHVKFLLATTDPKKVPVTVLSRCLQFQLKNIAPEKVAAYLAEILDAEGVVWEQGALDVIGRAARGSMRDALSITDQAIGYGQGQLALAAVTEMLGLVGRDEVGSLVDALATGDAAQVLAVVAELSERAVDFETLLGELLAALHDMAVSQALNDGQETAFDPDTVQLLYQIALMGYRDLQIAPDPRSGVEMTLLRMLQFAPNEKGRAVPPLDEGRVEGQVGSRGKDKASARASAPTEKSGAAKGSVPVEASAPASGKGPVEAREAEPLESARPDPSANEAAAGAGHSAVAEQMTDSDQQEAAPDDAAVSADQAAWYELVGTLELAGVARMIAEHSVLLEISEESVSLLLDEAHDTLLNGSQAEQIERALSTRLERSVSLTITPGTVSAETPAARRQRLADERQRAAEALLVSDDRVKDLLDEFDGSIDEVQPLDLSEKPSGPKAMDGDAHGRSGGATG
jgi:DNA polymerase-3 subunit gamma/tau